MIKNNYKFIDTHCHLDYLKPTVSESIELSNQHNVEKLITITVSKKNIESVFELTKTNSNLYCSQGIHPHEAKDFDDNIVKIIKKNISNPKVVAIGEIGLDYYYNFSDKKTQLDVFEKQLQLASELDYPVIIHSRDADDDMISILRNFLPTLKKRGVIHSFTGTQELADFAIKNDFFIGINGIVTFKKAEELRSVVKTLPIENILFETDSPYLTPVPFRGRENSPKNIPVIAEYLKNFLDQEEEIFYNKVYENSVKLFSLN